ncbi:MAG: hypothetical protein WCR71_05275 [Bacteroidales bacterium]
MKKYIFIIIISLIIFNGVQGQTKQHLIGVKAGYNISGLDTRPDLEHKTISTYQNFSLVYTYYHDLWGTMKIFGIQTGLSKQSQGYLSKDGANTYGAISIPLVSQFHLDFWRMRILLNAGCFGAYRYSMNNYDDSSFDEFDNKLDAGFIVGGGLAFILKPIEVHLEGNYQYSLTYLQDPKKFSSTEFLFTHPKQLIFSVSLNIRL